MAAITHRLRLCRFTATKEHFLGFGCHIFHRYKVSVTERTITKWLFVTFTYLVERGIVDDFRYAQRLTLSYSEKNIGPNKIKQKLYTKGFMS